MKIFIAIFIAGICLSFNSYSQLTGRVTDEATNLPLSGATISSGGKNLATTDNNGNFSTSCNQHVRLTVSYVGYENWQDNIKDCSTPLSIQLFPRGYNLNTVEITATSAQNKSLLYQPASITKLREMEIKRGTGLFLSDAINANVPGVSMNRRTVSAGQQFNIRGYGNGSRGTRGVSSNFDGQGYKVYLNGIPLTDAEGMTLLDDIDFGSIGNVEITKGPAGTLYGLAIAGVVNLKTIQPEKGKTSLGQQILVGNYGLRRYTTSFSMGKENSSLLINYGHQQSDGFMIHSKSEKDFVNIAGDFRTSTKQSFNFYTGYSNSYDQRAGELTLEQYAAKDYTGNPNYLKNNAHSEVISFRAGLGHTYAFTNNISNTTTVFGTGLSSNVSSAGGWTDKAPINYGLRSTFDTKFSYGNISLGGITGVETQGQRANTIGYNMKKNPLDTSAASHQWVPGDPYWVINSATSNNLSRTSTTSAFTEWTLGLPKDFSITAGLGWSNMKIALEDRFNTATATRPSNLDTTYKNMLSPHLALNKVFNKEFSIYAAYSKGYKAPVSSYFFITTPAGGTNPISSRINGALKPEEGNQFEIGSKGVLFNERLNYQLALFNAIFTNKITTVAVPNPNNTATLYSYVVNGGKQDHKGIEAALRFTPVKTSTGIVSNVSPFANFAYSDFKYEEFRFQSVGKTTVGNKDSVVTVDYSGKPVAGVSKITFNAGVDFAFKYGFYGNVLYSYRDGLPITSDSKYLSKSFNTINGKLGFRSNLSRHFDLDAFAGVDNITSTQYPYMVFINQLPDAYIPAPLNANWYGGINLKYNF
ncbi:MAG: TonB-dependent receptor [Ferruginibacter sp.]